MEETNIQLEEIARLLRKLIKETKILNENVALLRNNDNKKCLEEICDTVNATYRLWSGSVS